MSCIFSGCKHPANNTFGVRLRKPAPKNAIWAPETAASLCDHHATAGLRITVILQETNTGDVETNVAALLIGATSANRTTKIRKKP